MTDNTEAIDPVVEHMQRLLAGPARPLGALDLVAAAITGLAIWLEATADQQLRRFVSVLPDPVAVTLDPGRLSVSADLRLGVDAGAPAGRHHIQLVSSGPRASLVLIIERREPDAEHLKAAV